DLATGQPDARARPAGPRGAGVGAPRGAVGLLLRLDRRLGVRVTGLGRILHRLHGLAADRVHVGVGILRLERGLLVLELDCPPRSWRNRSTPVLKSCAEIWLVSA